MRILDLFCGAGGAARGYQLAGFHVTGVDIRPQPRYAGDHFCQADVMEVGLEALLRELGPFDAVHASPPCQGYSNLRKGDHPRLIEPVRELLIASGLPYVIENIQDAKPALRQPVRLCGSMFGLRVQRHRLFETSELPFGLLPPCAHGCNGRIHAYYGKGGANVQAAGRQPLLRGSVEQAKEDMGIDWMTWDELREAIPPAYTEWIGAQLRPCPSA